MLRRSLSSERRKAETRKKEMNEQLLRAERMVSLGMLADGAATDLESILKPVDECSTRALAAIPPDSLAATEVQSLHVAFQKVRAVVNDLQAIGRSWDHEKKEVNLNVVVDYFMKSPEFAAIRTCLPHVRIEVHLGSVMPPVMAAQDQLLKMINYLVLNGCESMTQGGTISLTTSAEHMEHAVGRYGSGMPGEYVVLRVKDSGRALAAEDVERIFEPFYTHKKMGRRFMSGLGMTLVYRVVEDHGGFIDIATGHGKGTMFSVFLPPASRTQEGVLELRPDYTGDETILVVDDYEEHRNAAAEILRGLGYRVLTAESGHACVSLLEQALKGGDKNRIDLVVLDLVLGDEFDGVETFKKLRELDPAQRAIMVSGFADIARIVEARKLGIGQCIQKPYALDSLGRAVRAELDS